jgi:glycosyltransferase involved in cell wall biosynthesis
MACNLPIVSVSVGDVPEIIGGTEGCYLCSQDPSDVSGKLLLALDHPKRTNGRENIKHMEQSVIAKRIIALYHEVLQKKNKKSSIVATGTAGDR